MLLALQNTVLESMASGCPLTTVGEVLCREVEHLVPDTFCSVLTVDRSGRLHSIAAPSLPPEFSAAIEGSQIGPAAGSCGTAAWRGEPVIVTDVVSDPLWADYTGLAIPHGIRACWSSPIRNEHGIVTGTFAFYYRQHRGPTDFEHDIVAASVHLCALAIERHEQLLESRRLIYTDALTGLGNRARFNDVAAAHDLCTDASWALLLIDVDDLKTVNDTFGHQAGDCLIRVIAERIAAAVPAMPIFRLGGDEFAVVIDGGDAAHAETFAASIVAALEGTAACDGHILVPAATIGIAHSGGAAAGSEQVRQNADLALYHAKETRRGGFIRYADSLGTSITRRMAAIKIVRSALLADQIMPFYQPLVDLVSRRTIGLEALCRIRREDGGFIPAEEFQEATSDAHVAKAITAQMLARVAADARFWLDRRVDFQRVAINLSPADFHGSTGLADRVAAIFAAAAVPLQAVLIEVTESVYLGRRDDIVSREIEAFRAYGMRIALDDFGTGYASLSHLLTVPIDVIKLDKSFVLDLEQDRGSAAIINGIARIAEKLGIALVGEGVETERQCAMLLSLGCTVGQGFHLASPMTRDGVMAHLLQASAAAAGEPTAERDRPWPLRTAR